MANKEQKMDELDKMNNVLSSGEQWIENNGKKLTAAVLVVILAVIGILLVKQFYLAPLEEEAQNAMFKGEFYFEQDNFEVALNGDEADFIGFKAVADEYSGTKAGNLANAYAGLCAYNPQNDNLCAHYARRWCGNVIYPQPQACNCNICSYPHHRFNRSTCNQICYSHLQKKTEAC